MGGTINKSNLIWYYPETTDEGDDHGGDIDDSSEIPDSTGENIFDDVSDTEAEDGDTEYRKIFIKNENSTVWKDVKAFISSNTESSDDSIGIAKGGEKDTREDFTLSGDLTFEDGSATVTGDGTSFESELGAGDMIQLDDDGVYYEVSSVTDDTELELTESYSESGGTGSGTREGAVSKTYVEPDAVDHDDVLDLGSIGENGYRAIWIERVVNSDSDGYTDNSFVIEAQST